MTTNRPCPRCGETYATGFDIQVQDGEVFDLRWLVCDSCGHETKPRRKRLGSEAAAWPDPAPHPTTTITNGI